MTNPNGGLFPVRTALLMLLGAAMLLGANLGGYGVWAPDEPRFAQVAREMMLRGNYLVPQVNGEDYLEKPPLLFWAIAAFSQLTGDVTPLTARIPSWLGGVMTLVLTWMLAWRMFGARVAFWSAAILATGYRFWWQTRTGQIDMLLTACTTLALYHLWQWDQDRKFFRLPVIYGAVAAGMLAKGPPAAIFPLMLILSLYWRDKDSRKAVHWVAGLAGALLIVMLWYIPARLAIAGGGETTVAEGIGGNLFRNTIGRAVMGVSKAQWPWYYVVSLPSDWLPWTLFLPWVAWRTWKNRHADRMRHFLWCWTLPAFLLFSAAVGKRAIYILPLYPALAILTALAVLELMDSDRVTWRKRTGLVWAAALLLIGLAPHALLLTEHADKYTPGAFVVSVAALAAAAATLACVRRNECRNLHVSVAGSAALLFTGAAFVVFPALDPYKSAERVCAPVRTLSELGQDYDLFCVGFSREEYVFYSEKFHESVLTDLVGRASIPPDRLMQAARLQLHAKDAIEEAVEDIPIADLASPTPEERAALLKALHTTLEEEEERIVGALHFEEDLRAELGAFARRLDSARPAFLFVQAEDWRWVVPFLPETLKLHGLVQREVGRRDALLLANDAGKALLDRFGVAY
ncbi:MAG: glycosyltransferase family 39 protein [Candidatus Hydrogenedentes bacterium]|nr:glycosyltransferase family 39 protein [Candidatus Hydrogenedentota bacterium]